MKTATAAAARAASIIPNTALPEEFAAAGADMVDSGVGEGLAVGGGVEVAEGDGSGGEVAGEVGTVVAVATDWVASTMIGAVGDGAASVGFVSVGATLTLGTGEGEGGGTSVGVSIAGPVGIGVGEGRAVVVGGGVSIAWGVYVGVEEVAVTAGAVVAVTSGAGVAVAAGTGVAVAVDTGGTVATGVGVAVAADPGVSVTVGVGDSVPSTTTRLPSTVNCWALAALSITRTSCNPKTLLPSPWAMQVRVARTPVPLGPAVLPRLTLTAPKVAPPSALFTSDITGIAEFPVLSRKAPRVTSVTCRIEGS